MTYTTEAFSKGFSPNFIYHCLPELDIIHDSTDFIIVELFLDKNYFVAVQ